ncbi:MAG: lytic murein transglycosylase, partial [Roseiarcus sp.]
MTTFAPIHPHWPRAPWLLLARLIAAFLAIALAAALAFHPVPASAAVAKPSDVAFRNFVAELWPLAKARGVSRATFDAAFRGVTFDAGIVAHTKNQAEFVMP